MFVDSELVAQIEFHAALKRIVSEKRAEYESSLCALQNEETRARERCQWATEKELEAYCKSHEGRMALAAKLREKKDLALAKMTKAEAKAQARLDLKTDMLLRNVRKISQEFERKRDDLSDLDEQKRQEIMERAKKPLRVGAMCHSKRSNTGRNFFHGSLCHIAVYLRALPADTIRAHHFAGVQATNLECDRLYALAGAKFRAALALAPNDLDVMSSYAQSIADNLDLKCLQTKVAAAVYRHVLSDLRLSHVFGPDLSWLPALKSAPAVVATVLQAESDDDERVISLELSQLDYHLLEDADIVTLINNRRLAVVLNLTSCRRVTDRSMQRIAQVLLHLQSFSISGCYLITGKYLPEIISRNPSLTVLRLIQCQGVGSLALSALFSACNGLKTVDLSYNANVTDEVVRSLATCCRQLENLHLQFCSFITDVGVQALAVETCNSLTFLDLSGCVLLSDDSVSALGQLCRELRHLNLKSVNRVTEEGARSIVHNCWALEFLCFDDVYRLKDSAFIVDSSVDKRQSVEVNMLGCITNLNLHDCYDLTDTVVDQIMKRAPAISILNLGGCSNLTDLACSSIVRDPVTGLQRGKVLTSLNLCYCLKVTDEGLRLIASSLKNLQYVNLSGCVQLTDTGILALASTCALLQEVILAHCKNLTDRTLCYLADFLWVEYLDISHCNRITDDGVEVIAIESAGLRKISLTQCFRLTNRALDILSMHCPHLTEIELYNVPNCNKEVVDRFKAANTRITVLA